MSNVLAIFNGYFEKKDTKRIRFKVDPTLKSGFDIAKTYEGFVLSESFDTDTVIYIPLGDNMGLHDMEGILPIPDRLGPIKDKIAQVLKGKPGEEYLQQIMCSNCFDEIQQYLKHAGYTDTDIIDLLKCMITNEGILPPKKLLPVNILSQQSDELLPPQSADYTLARGGRAIRSIPGKVGRFGKSLLKAPFKAGEKLSKWKRQADKATSYLKTFDRGYLNNADRETWINNPNLKSQMFISDPDFMKWYDTFGDLKGNINAARNILQNFSVKQLNYVARKFYEQTNKYIS